MGGEGLAAPIHQTPPVVMAAVVTAIMAAGSQMEVLHCWWMFEGTWENKKCFRVIETSALLWWDT